jgi:hypothetical protein
MSQDDKVIGYMSQAELLALMRETGMIAIQDTTTVDGKPVIHALLKIVNAQTGAELPGGLPFSVVMFKGAGEAGFSNIAIGTVVPAAELEIELPADFFNLCNQRFRFVRAFPLDGSAFVLQMDLFLRNATREYVKFNFGLWSAIFSQVLFELMGSDSTGVNRAAEVYAMVRSNAAERFAQAIAVAPAAEEAAPVEAEPVPAVAPVETPEAEQSIENPPEAAPEAEAKMETPEAGEATAPAEAEKLAEAVAEDKSEAAEAADPDAVLPPVEGEPELAKTADELAAKAEPVPA